MATITVDGRQIEAPEGANLLEVLKGSGTYISSLCYIDGLPPYAGCRMCLVEIEGLRGLQLSCTSRVADNLVIRTQIPEVAEARKQVLSIILANHSDRCLTCHRREHCHPGDICLRDGVVTHRCLTCPKNYRCELQATCEVVGMSLYEPWEGEARSFYAVEEHLHPLRPCLRRDPAHQCNHPRGSRFWHPNRLRRGRANRRIQLRFLRRLHRCLPHRNVARAPAQMDLKAGAVGTHGLQLLQRRLHH